jgi:hypothetical protein
MLSAKEPISEPSRLPATLEMPQIAQRDFAYLTNWHNQIPTEWYNAVVLAVQGIFALVIARVILCFSAREANSR